MVWSKLRPRRWILWSLLLVSIVSGLGESVAVVGVEFCRRCPSGDWSGRVSDSIVMQVEIDVRCCRGREIRSSSWFDAARNCKLVDCTVTLNTTLLTSRSFSLSAGLISCSRAFAQHRSVQSFKLGRLCQVLNRAGECLSVFCLARVLLGSSGGLKGSCLASLELAQTLSLMYGECGKHSL